MSYLHECKETHPTDVRFTLFSHTISHTFSHANHGHTFDAQMHFNQSAEHGVVEVLGFPVWVLELVAQQNGAPPLPMAGEDSVSGKFSATAAASQASGVV